MAIISLLQSWSRSQGFKYIHGSASYLVGAFYDGLQDILDLHLISMKEKLLVWRPMVHMTKPGIFLLSFCFTRMVISFLFWETAIPPL